MTTMDYSLRLLDSIKDLGKTTAGLFQLPSLGDMGSLFHEAPLAGLSNTIRDLFS
jgi:hypothetical protein